MEYKQDRSPLPLCFALTDPRPIRSGLSLFQDQSLVPRPAVSHQSCFLRLYSLPYSLFFSGDPGVPRVGVSVRHSLPLNSCPFQFCGFDSLSPAPSTSPTPPVQESISELHFTTEALSLLFSIARERVMSAPAHCRHPHHHALHCADNYH